VPLVRAATIRRLIELCGQEHADVIYPRFTGERGHPPLIAGRLAREIAGWQGRGGLKAALSQWGSTAFDLEVADGNILLDMDTAEDYLRLQEKAERMDIPTSEECRALMENVFHVGEDIFRHCRAVAQVATCLGMELNRAECCLDIPLLEAAALLHDLAKGKEDHARSGALLLVEQGFGGVAGPVATHMDITITEGEAISAGEVLYLADKMVRGERCFAPEVRFRAKMERYAGDPDILDIIKGRLKTAQAIQRRIETKLGRPLEDICDIN
jgi:hypothetical protein